MINYAKYLHSNCTGEMQVLVSSLTKFKWHQMQAYDKDIYGNFWV